MSRTEFVMSEASMSDAPSIAVSRTIDAPVETNWWVLTDLEQLPDVLSAVMDVEILEGGETFDVGTRWRETRKMMRKEATEEMYVSHVEPLRSFTVEADNGGVRYVSTYAFTPAGGAATEVTTTFTALPTGSQNVVIRLLGKLGIRMMRKSLAKDLEDIAAASESAAASASPT